MSNDEPKALPADLRLSAGLAARVRSARKAARMTQQTLAEACGLERTSVTNLEAGRQIPKLPALYRMAEALKMRPDELLGNLAGPPPVQHNDQLEPGPQDLGSKRQFGL